jgi:hypothetical protein
MRALAVMEEPREAWADEDSPRPRRPDARLARLRLAAARGDVDVDAVAAALVRRLEFTAALRAELTDG